MQPTFDQAFQMLSLAREAGVSLETLQALYGTGLLSDLLKVKDPTAVERDAFRRIIGLNIDFVCISPVQVNYDLSVEAAIRAGHYDWKNENIMAANFPSTRQGAADLDIILVHYDRDMESEPILKDLDKQGLRPAELPELLAFGAKYPEVQREFPIVALGSVWLGLSRGDRYVPYLFRRGDRRNLGLYWLGLRWSSDYRFAAVRK